MKDIRLQPGLIGKLDALLHWLHVPHWLMRPICDRYERKLCEGSPWTLYGQTWTSNAANTKDVTWTITYRA